jgi:hypothetical protein
MLGTGVITAATANMTGTINTGGMIVEVIATGNATMAATVMIGAATMEG